MANLVSSDSDSDLEVLQQLSDWECEDELAQRTPSRSRHERCSPPRFGEASPSEDELVAHTFLLPDEELVQHNLSQSNGEWVQHSYDDLVRQNDNDYAVQQSPPHPDKESAQPQSGPVVKRRISRRHRRVEDMQNLNDAEFTFRFRLSKSAVEVLLTEIMPYVQVTSRRNNGVSPLHQLLLTLRFYALGTMLVSVAEVVGVSKSSACRIVQGISAAIARLYEKHVVLYQNSAINFYKIAQFPRVLGAIDCTHIRIQSPNHSIGDEFKNREGYFSLNVQAVCDADMRLMNVVARWPGSIDDDTVFDNSVIRSECEGGAFGNRWLLGDTAYPSRTYLLTPILNAASPNELRYNEAHYKTWNTIQRTIALWKRRFPVIAFTLRLRLHNIQNVIISTAVLHNICIDYNLEEIPPEVDLPQDMPQNMGVSLQNMEVQDFGQRADLVENYFEV